MFQILNSIDRSLQILDAVTSSPSSLLVLLLIFLLFQRLYGWCTMSDMQRKANKLVMSPFELPILGSTLRVIANTNTYLDLVLTLAEQFDNHTFRVNVIGAPIALVASTPELFEDISKTQFECFERGPYYCENVRDLMGNGIFTTDGVAWVHQRKTASNLFTMNILREAMSTSVKKRVVVMTQILQRSQTSGQPMDLAKLLNKFTMEVFAEIGFGVDLGCLDTAEDHTFQKAFDAAQRTIFMRFIRPVWFWKTLRWLNAGRERELKQHMRVIDDLVYSIINESLEKRGLRGQSQGGSWMDRNIVSLFLDHSAEPEAEIDPVFLRDIVVNFLLAGRDTIAQAMSWFFYALSQNPHVEAKIRQELQTKLPELLSGELQAPNMDQASELFYLDAALKETLRLYPSVPSNFKQAKHDTVLCDGTFVKKGTCVMTPSYVIGRTKHVWGADATVFNPMRWLDPETERPKPMSPFQFHAFGGGPRRCLGLNLSMNEMKIVTATLLARFRLQLLPGQHVTYDPSITLPMKNPLLVRVESV